MEWNDAQRKAIKERHRNILVSAAAGSGKTAVLTERIKRLIVEDGVSLDNMLIVTFTNAAASEMRERIARAIGEEIRGGKVLLREQLARLSSANISTFHAFCLEVIRQYFYMIDMKPDAKICDEAQKKILQEDSMDELLEESFISGDKVFIAFLHKYASSRNESDVRDMILSVYNFILSIPDPFSWLGAATEKLNAEASEMVKSQAFQYVFKQIEFDIDRSVRYLEKVVELIEKAGTENILKKALNDNTAICLLRDVIKKRDYDLFATDVSNIKFETFSVKKDERAAFEEIRDEVKFLRDKAKKIIRDIAEKYMYQSAEQMADENKMTYQDACCLRELVERFHRIYSEKKEEKGLIDFNDAEHFALKILENKEVSAEYRNKFTYIFVDEYQDINVVQETLLNRIKRENNLFMVGDVKQSIYRFRLAEPTIFMNKYETYKKGESPHSVKIDLNQNFRSKSGVIDFTNMIFSNVMTKQSCDMEYDADARLYKGLKYEGVLEYAAQVYVVDMAAPKVQPVEDAKPAFSDGKPEVLEVGSAFSDGKPEVLDAKPAFSGGKPEVLEVGSAFSGDGHETLDDEDDPIQNMQKTELEAIAAARIIKETIKAPIYDEKKSEQREISYRDIAVLFRAMKEPGIVYQEVFDRENIPVYAELEDGYFDTIEIGTFLNLLKVIDNKCQDLPLLSVLYSGIFGFTINELAEIRLKSKNTPFFKAFFLEAEKMQEVQDANEATPLNQKSAHALDKINRWRQFSRIMPLDDFLWTLLQESGYYEYIGAMPKGVQRTANLRMLVDKAAGFQSGAVKDIFSFITYVEQLRTTGAAWQQAKILGENDDVVRLMTVHKSKGLEFSTVIVTGLGRKCNMASESYKVSLHRDMGIALRCVDPENYSYRKTFLQRAIEQRERREMLAEEMRVMYVAFTRAKDKLILLGTMKDVFSEMQKHKIKGTFDPAGADKFFDWIIPAMIENGLEPIVYSKDDIGTYKKQVRDYRDSIKGEIRNGFAIDDCAAIDLISKRLSWQYPYQEAMRIPSKLSVSDISRHASDSFSGPDISRHASDSFSEPDISRHVSGSFSEPDISRHASGSFSGPDISRHASDTFSGPDISRHAPDSFSERDIRRHTSDSFQTANVNTTDLLSAEISQNIPALVLPKELAAHTETLTAAQRGTAMHSAILHLDFKKSSDIKSIKRQVENMLEKELLTEAEAKSINAYKIQRMLDSDIGKRMRCADKLYRETTFNLKKTAKSLLSDIRFGNDEILIQGAIDCYFEERVAGCESPRYILVDYKTDRVNLPDSAEMQSGKQANLTATPQNLPTVNDLISHYRPQLALYKEALEQIKGIKVDEVYLYFFSIDQAAMVEM